MTSVDKDSFTVSALGKQAQSARHTIPTGCISKTGRHHYDKVHFSEEHTKVAKLGRESPPGGHIYKVKSTLASNAIGFGTAKRDITTLKRTSTTQYRPGEFFAPQVEDPDDIPTNDALDLIPDTQPFKYRKDPTIIIGTEPRGKLKEATLMKNHSVAFYGRDSPGPAAIGGEFGPQLGPTKPSFAQGSKFQQSKRQVEKAKGDNPPEVGPGRHSRKDFALGQQHLTQRRNQMVNEFSHAPKFKKERVEDTISKVDAARSALGKQVLNRNRSEPSVGFSVDNRQTRSKTKLCMTRLDEGPRANFTKFTASMPMLPPERVIMSSGCG